MDWRAVDQALERGVDQGVASAVSLTVGRRGGLLHKHLFGKLGIGPDFLEISPRSVFDLASLTKPLATAPACLALVEAGELDLNAPLGRWLDLPPDKAALTPGQLLSHTSGLPAWRPWHLELARLPRPERPVRLMELLAAEPLEYEPGQGTVYSDLGFMLLQLLVERISGLSLAEIAISRFYEPLGLRDLGFVVLPDGPGRNRHRFVASEDCPWRGRILQGEVNDENAWALGGFAGQAGLFGAGEPVWRLMDWLAASAEGPDDRDGHALPRILSPDIARLIFDRPFADCSRTFGFDTPSGERSAAGRLARTGDVIGHLGFTGTSVWHRRADGLTVVLLTNRTIFGRDNNLIADFRVAIHDLIADALGE